MTREELAAALLAVTPAPPDDLEPEALLAAFAAVYTAREEILAPTRLSAPTGPSDTAAVARLTDLDRRWLAALTAVREQLTALGASRGGTAGKLAAYTAGSSDL